LVLVERYPYRSDTKAFHTRRKEAKGVPHPDQAASSRETWAGAQRSRPAGVRTPWRSGTLQL